MSTTQQNRTTAAVRQVQFGLAKIRWAEDRDRFRASHEYPPGDPRCGVSGNAILTGRIDGEIIDALASLPAADTAALERAARRLAVRAESGALPGARPTWTDWSTGRRAVLMAAALRGRLSIPPGSRPGSLPPGPARDRVLAERERAQARLVARWGSAFAADVAAAWYDYALRRELDPAEFAEVVAALKRRNARAASRGRGVPPVPPPCVGEDGTWSPLAACPTWLDLPAGERGAVRRREAPRLRECHARAEIEEWTADYAFPPLPPAASRDIADRRTARYRALVTDIIVAATDAGATDGRAKAVARGACMMVQRDLPAGRNFPPDAAFPRTPRQEAYRLLRIVSAQRHHLAPWRTPAPAPTPALVRLAPGTDEREMGLARLAARRWTRAHIRATYRSDWHRERAAVRLARRVAHGGTPRPAPAPTPARSIWARRAELSNWRARRALFLADREAVTLLARGYDADTLRGVVGVVRADRLARAVTARVEGAAAAKRTEGVRALRRAISRLTGITTVGLEIETEGVHPVAMDARLPRGWSAVHDGSLASVSAEIVSPVLRHGDRIDLRGLSIALLPPPSNGGGARERAATASRRCGVHVHVGAEAWTGAQIGAIAEAWAEVEPRIMSLYPPYRERASYCEPIRGKRDVIAAAKARSCASGTSRYMALNLHALRKHGTLEFRVFNGTVDLSQIAQYVNIVAAVVRKGLRRAQEDRAENRVRP